MFWKTCKSYVRTSWTKHLELPGIARVGCRKASIRRERARARHSDRFIRERRAPGQLVPTWCPLSGAFVGGEASASAAPFSLGCQNACRSARTQHEKPQVRARWASTRLARSQFAKSNCQDFSRPKWNLNVLTILILIKRFANQHPPSRAATTKDLLVQRRVKIRGQVCYPPLFSVCSEAKIYGARWSSCAKFFSASNHAPHEGT